MSSYVQTFGQFSRNARLYLIFNTIEGLIFSLYFLFFNLFILARGFEKDFLGLLTAIPSLVGLVFAFPAGAIADRIGCRRALLLGTSLWTLPLAGIILLTDKVWLSALSVVSGCAQTLVMVSGAPFLTENSTPQERTSLFSASFGLSTLIGFLGNLVGGLLPALFAALLSVDPESVPAYQGTLWVMAGLSLASLIPLALIRQRERVEPVPSLPSTPGRPDSAPLPGKLIGQLLLPNAVTSVGAALLIPYMNVFFKEKFPIPDSTLGAMFSVSSVAMGLAVLASPLLAGRLGKIRALVLTQLASIPFLLTIGFAPWFGVAMVAFWVRGALMNMGSPLYQAFAIEQVDEHARARVSSLMGMGWNIGWSVGPYLSGLIQMRAGFSPIFLITAGTYVAGSVMPYAFFAKADPVPLRQSS
jgi:MFS family permease